ncbi:MAG: amidohydrolase [Treponema sp.]|nr:amidohydrolase [Treponema sp.]
MAKIDFHAHVAPPEIHSGWGRVAQREPYYAQLRGRGRGKFAICEEVISMLNASGFDKAVIFGFGFKDQALCQLVNDYVIEKTRRFTDRLVGFAAVAPGAKWAEREIARCHDAGLSGVGEIYPVGQEFDLERKVETRSLCGACRERGIPLIVHVSEPVGKSHPGKTASDLGKIERFVSNNQGLRIVLAHFGGGLMFYESMPELREKFRDVYYDTAAAPLLYNKRVYSAAIALGLGAKLLFGSDFPMLRPSRYMEALKCLEREDRDLILGANAESLLSAGAPIKIAAEDEG